VIVIPPQIMLLIALFAISITIVATLFLMALQYIRGKEYSLLFPAILIEFLIIVVLFSIPCSGFQQIVLGNLYIPQNVCDNIMSRSILS
jgi:hypothetical protein